MLSVVAASGGYSSLQCVGFSLRWLLLLQSMGSRHAGFHSCGSRALECRLSSCGARASLLHGLWELPRLGLEPLSPASAGGFLTTVPPGKPFPPFKNKMVANCHQCSTFFFYHCNSMSHREYSIFYINPYVIPYIDLPLSFLTAA